MKLKVLRDLNIGALGFSASLDHEGPSDSAIRKSAQAIGFKFPLKGETPFDTFEQEQSTYLKFCNATLFNFFKEGLGDSFLFSALSFKREKGPGSKAGVEIVTGDDPETDYNLHKEVIGNWEEIRGLLRKFLDEIINGEVISLTTSLIGIGNLFDLFFVQSKSTYGKRIVNPDAKIKVYKLSDLKYVEDIDEFLSLNKRKIDEFIQKATNSRTIRAEGDERQRYARYIWNYKNLADRYAERHAGKDFFLHLIKSSTFQSKYNILLSLATNRLLTEDELVFTDLLIHRIVSETAVEKAREIQRSAWEAVQHATRAAISQVLARNMSHNIGSHVSYKATNLAVKKRIADLYPELTPKDLFNDEKIVEWIDLMSEKLDKYEIHRNEYLADYSLSPQSFHFYKDVILPFCENTLILDNIASMEGANYPKSDTGVDGRKEVGNRLKIRVFIKKEGEKQYVEIKARYPDLSCMFESDDLDKEIIYPDNFPYLLKNRDAKSSLSSGINSKRIEDPDLDIEVLMHSEQGLYSILENFIRNSAKHNKDKIREAGLLEIRLHLEVSEKLPDRYSLIISDNVSNLPGEKLFNASPENLGLYDRMKSKIVVDGEKSGKQNLGFADMNINSFLFRFNPSDISNKTLTRNLHLVTLKHSLYKQGYDRVYKKLPQKEHRFGYLLKLLKPRKVLWIGDDIRVGKSADTISTLKKNGIFYFPNVEDAKNLSHDKEIAAFDFVVFCNSFDKEYYEDHQIHFPARVFVIGEDLDKLIKPNVIYIKGFDDISTADELIEGCWVEWLNRLKKPTAGYVYYEENAEAGRKLDDTRLEGAHSIRCANSLRDETPLDNNAISVIYDHHGWVIDRTKLALKEGEDFEPVTNFYTRNSKIFFDKGSDDFVSLSYLPDESFKRKILAYQLIDAATTNIFILDERIAMFANEMVTNSRDDKSLGIRSEYDSLNFSRFCYGKVFAINNIHIEGDEDKFIHSDKPRYYLSMRIGEMKISFKSETSADDVLGDIDEINKDILVLHRTYLKRETLGMEVQRFLKLAYRQFGSVIITSGGGYPHSLLERVKFVPFSIVERCVSSRLSKLKLTSYLQRLKFVV